MIDTATVSQFDFFKPIDYKLHLEIDFHKTEINGKCEIQIQRIQKTNELHIDVLDLAIKSVSINSKPATYSVKDFTSYGKQLVILLPDVSEKFSVVIEYVASTGPALCWLTPNQTFGKNYPYFFTQGECCLNRSLFPCFDTPTFKTNYDLEIVVEKQFTAVASADLKEVKEVKDGFRCFVFEMKQPIPSYLLAIAVGNIVSKPIGPRSSVWCEPEMIDACQKEFDVVTEQYIHTAEKLFGKYRWSKYDLLIMPPSFPFGGMENPLLTFVTPSILAGDKSLTDTVAHEISHSWFGNLVTNTNWSDFWVNEGFTMYSQRRILEELHGLPLVHLEATTQTVLYLRELESQGYDSNISQLRPKVGDDGVLPEETCTAIPYEKGYACVCYLKELVHADNKTFDKFLEEYVNHFAWQSVCSEQVFDFYCEYFGDKNLLSKEKIEELLYKRGLPEYMPSFNEKTKLTDVADKLAELWIEKSELTEIQAKPYSEWATYQKIHFLNHFIDSTLTNPSKTLPLLEKFYHLSQENSEIKTAWILISIKYSYEPTYPLIKSFLKGIGRGKFVFSIHRALLKNPKTKHLSLEIYKETELMLHSIIKSKLNGIINS